VFDVVVLDRFIQSGKSVLFVARDDRRIAAIESSLEFFAAQTELVKFPAWDCLPYDRVSPKNDIIAKRVDALTNLADTSNAQPRIVLTSVAALLQRVPACNSLKDATLFIGVGGATLRDILITYLENNGYGRSETVMEPGEYAIRGGIIDLYPPGFKEPFRLDFFGDELDAIRTFEPFSQRTSGGCESFALKPFNELSLNENAISLFRSGYRALFGVVSHEDPLRNRLIAFSFRESSLNGFRAKLSQPPLVRWLNGSKVRIASNSSPKKSKRNGSLKPGG
jgi:transcription-repair coupling factor (superfamily II helicase)